MREIKFRGKDILHKSWQYGSLAKDEPQKAYYIIDNEYSRGIDVDENTIGQYTGLHDKNGKEIYEGDVLKSIQWNDIYLVKYIGTAFYLCRKGNNGFNKITTWNNAEKAEIIGNITDNPELLGAIRSY